MKTKFTEKELVAISQIQQLDSITRKAAVRKFQRNRDAYMAECGAAAAIAPAKEKVAKKAKAEPKPNLTPAQVSANRSEGLRLFKLAGRPKKSHFVAVYGKKGPAMTWDARAKSVGLESAEEAAASFQKMLAKASR